MDPKYLAQLFDNPTYKDAISKLDDFKTTNPVKTAFIFGIGSGFLIGCIIGLRNTILLSVSVVTTYYCYVKLF